MSKPTIAIFGQTHASQDIETVVKFVNAAKNLGCKLIVEAEFQKLLSHKNVLHNNTTFTLESGLQNRVDLFVSFGGDGTILRAVTFLKDNGIPLVGVNTGRLGFLSTVKKEEVLEVLPKFLKQEFTLEQRTLVQVSLKDKSVFGSLNFALNEITISRKDTTSMITVDTYLDGEFLTSYWADGLIIATPTGSTGYSLSCGGPVIAPNTKALVLTPIAPHNLNARPLVIPDSTKLRMVVSGREKNHLISLDSRIATIANGTEITIAKAPFTTTMVQYHTESFLKTIRKKLLWGQDQRN